MEQDRPECNGAPKTLAQNAWANEIGAEEKSGQHQSRSFKPSTSRGELFIPPIPTRTVRLPQGAHQEPQQLLKQTVYPSEEVCTLVSSFLFFSSSRFLVIASILAPSFPLASDILQGGLACLTAVSEIPATSKVDLVQKSLTLEPLLTFDAQSVNFHVKLLTFSFFFLITRRDGPAPSPGTWRARGAFPGNRSAWGLAQWLVCAFSRSAGVVCRRPPGARRGLQRLGGRAACAALYRKGFGGEGRGIQGW